MAKGRSIKQNSCHDLLAQILGKPVDQKTLQIIKDYIQHDTKSYGGEKYPIFKGYLVERKKFSNRKEEAIFKESKLEEAKILITNILILHSLFHKELIVKKLIHQGFNQEVKDRLNLVEKQLKARFSAYYYWMMHFEKFKTLLKKGISFNKENIHTLLLEKPHTSAQIPDFLKSDFKGKINFQKSHLLENINALNLHAIRLIETIEETKSSQEEEPDALAEEAKQYVQLKEFGIAEKILENVLKKDPENSQAWYLKALIYLHRRAKAMKEFSNLSSQIEYGGFEEEQWFGDARDFAADEYLNNESKALDVFLKACQFWPLVHQNLYEDQTTRSFVVMAVIELFHLSIQRNWYGIFANTFDQSKKQNQIIISILKEVFEFEIGYGLGSGTRYHIEKIVDRLWVIDIRCLEIYETLNPQNYSDYFQHWWNNYGRRIEDKECIENSRFMSQLQRNLSFEELFQFVETARSFLNYTFDSAIFSLLAQKSGKELKGNLDSQEISDFIQKAKLTANAGLDASINTAIHCTFIDKIIEIYQQGNFQRTLEILENYLNYQMTQPLPQNYTMLVNNHSLKYDHHTQILYLLLRSTYDLATTYFEDKKFNDSVETLWKPFESQKDILTKLVAEFDKESNSKPTYLIIESVGYYGEFGSEDFQVDLFGNYGSILEEIDETKYSSYHHHFKNDYPHLKKDTSPPSLQNLIAQLKKCKKELKEENLKKLEEIEKQFNQFQERKN